MRRLLQRLNQEERGIALVMALGMLTVLGIMVVTVVDYSTSGTRTAYFSKSKMSAFDAADAGMNDIVAVLNKATNNSLDSTILPSCSLAQTSWNHYVYAGGTADSCGDLDRSAAVWSLKSIGAIRNPTGPKAGNVTRTLTAKVSIVPTYTQPANNPSWNYIMSTQVTGGLCDMTLADGGNTGNPLTVSAQLYVYGNLCIGTSQGGTATAIAPVVVKGKVTIQEGSSGIGTSGSPVSSVHVGNGCQYLSNPLHNPCRNGAPSAGDNVFATVIDANPTLLTAPHADFANWYTNGIPGPKQPCTFSTGTPPTFDNNTVRDNSVPAVFDLTPASSYTCRVGPGAQATLTSAMTASQTTINVSSATGFPATGTYRIRVDDELMTVTGGQGSTTWTVTRAVNGSTATTHVSSQTVEWDDANTSGELNWNATTKTVTVKGTIYIDGSATVSQAASYNGQASLYLSGTFLMNGSKLCAKMSGSNCDTASWNPNTDLLTIVADGNGGNGVPAGHSIYLNNASFQGALYATNMVRLEGTTSTDGPIIGTNVELGYNVSTSTATASFPSITIVPVGMPSNPVVYAQPNPPQGFSG